MPPVFARLRPRYRSIFSSLRELRQSQDLICSG
jgi:hypothetical protein